MCGREPGTQHVDEGNHFPRQILVNVRVRTTLNAND
jgi:hypothetical protein